MSEEKSYYVYLLASRRNGTLYVGVTNDLIRLVYEHRTHAVDGFTRKHGVHILVYYEQGRDIEAAIARERQIKKWNRSWKIELIEKENPDWLDLYETLI